MKHKRSKKWDVAKYMPPLRRSLPGQPFDVHASEAAQWLCSQPDILQIMFEAVKDKEIVYDPVAGTWQGIEYGMDQER